MEGNVKLLGIDGMCGMEFTGDKVNVYNDEGYVIESMTTRSMFRKLLIFLKIVRKKWRNKNGTR
ncbi:hypothetical protein [Bacillus tropicus]|uniref:hypothetical protein n=1 Tax=Bacillus tropicus TaxID=2026188 RepID=UPI0013E945E6|nr:hypothetical protein [Bacillus tropicus]